MADEPQFSTTTEPTLQQLVDYFVDSMHDAKRVKQWETAIENATSRAGMTARGALVKVAVPFAKILGGVIAAVEEAGAPALVPVLTELAGRLIGQPVSENDLRRAANADTETPIGSALADLALRAMTPKSDALEPGVEGARRFLSTLTQFTANAWMEGALFELLTTIIPDMDSFESVAELPHELVSALGLGRLARRALGPLADINISTPLKWQLNKQYRPTLLGASTVVRQFTRGRWDWEDVEEELARDGYSSERIDALLSEQIKRLGLDDLAFLLWSELLSLEEAIKTTREDGYDEQTASKLLNTQKLKREDAIYRLGAVAAIDAFVDRRLDDLSLWDTLSTNIPSEHERDLLLGSAKLRQALNTKVLSPSQAESCVKAGILAVADYRAALKRDGYNDADALSLELLLRKQLDEKQSIEDARAAAAADRAAEKAAKDSAAAAKRQEIADAQALKRRGSLAELEHAVVIGLIPITRLEEVLNASFDADTVAIYVADVEQKRVTYVSDQQKRDDAAKRATNKGLNVGQLEAAVYAGVLTVDQFSSAIAASGVAAGDVDILARTVAAKLADLAAAKRARDEAATRAAQQRVPLLTIEQLVLRGLRPMTAYDQALTTLGFDDAQRAAMRELLQAKVDERADAAALREQQRNKDTSRGLSLEQFRNAVIAGTRTIDQFQAFLVANKYTTDAIAVLVDELAADVDAAAAAQQRRDRADAASGRAGVAVTTAARAARLGVITPDAYQAALEAAGYSADDIALELELLVAEMATAKGTKKLEASTATPASTHGLTLAQVATAVKAGAATRADYISAAGAAGLTDDAIATLAAQLDDELAAIADAKGRRQQIVPALAAAGVDLADLENQVRAGTLTVAAFEDRLEALGYGATDAQLVGSLLETELGAA